MSSVRFRRLEPFELNWANDRYSEVDFVHSTSGDLIAVALVDGTPAALGRVTHVGPSVGELGGLYVFPDFRGMGLAKPLVTHLVEESGLTTLFCLPFEPLEALYESCGFSAHQGGADVPQTVLRKHAWCNQHYAQPVLLMSRNA